VTSKVHYGFSDGTYLEGKSAAERVIARLNGQDSQNNLELMSSP
jgi:hypothetical protein